MPAPSKHLERTRGRILAESEQLRVASRVELVNGTEWLNTKIRGRLYLALTDRRLLLVNSSIWASRSRLLSEWPTGKLSISVTRRKLGGNLIHILPTGKKDESTASGFLSFEWVNGHRPREWANYRFRQ